MSAIGPGRVKTTWKYGTGKSSAWRLASHSLAAAAWHFGQCPLRQELYEMRRWAQASQRSTCPPNAAVRQRSIADMTLSWPRLTWPAWDARQAGPRCRKMSATSTAGRDNGRASAGHLPQEVERAGHLADRVDRDAGVERRRVEFLMSQ